MSALQEIAVDLEADRTTNAPDKNILNNNASSSLGARFEGLSIGRKVTLFFAANLAITLLAACVVIAALIETSNRSQLTAETHRSAFLVERLVVELSEAQRHSEVLLATGETSRGESIMVELDRAQGSLTDLGNSENVSLSAYSDRIGVITASVARNRTRFEAAITAETRGDAGGLTAEDLAAGQTAVAAARDLAVQLDREAEALAASKLNMISTVLSFWISVAAILVLLTLLSLRYFDRHVGKALSNLAGHMTRLSSGERIREIEESNRKDEIGEMTRAVIVFNRASITLERLSREQARNAHEELEEQARLQKQKEEDRIERERALRQIADQFEHKVGDVVAKVASASSELQSTATSMAASADQASTRTGEVTSAMQDANSGATAAAAASDEFATSIGEVSRQAASSAELARKASASTKQADSTISKLSESAEQVGEIVELIQTIAQRTNLLALNASIEAARGGESGRGFAVVASEVKELAMQTSRATDQVAQQIRDMQDTTGASVSALRSIASEVAELENVAVSIAGAVDQQSSAGHDLARSIDMAARGTDQVSEHIQEVQELSTSTGRAASDVLCSATALEHQAVTLRAQVDGFLEEVRAG